MEHSPAFPSLLVLFNAAPGHMVSFTLPELDEQQPWEMLLDTSTPWHYHIRFPTCYAYNLQPFTVALFRLYTPIDEVTTGCR